MRDAVDVSCIHYHSILQSNDTGRIPDSKVHGANMGPTWVLSVPDVSHIGPMNLAFRDTLQICSNLFTLALFAELPEALFTNIDELEYQDG